MHPPLSPITDVLVCTTCRPAGAPREGPADGQRLWEAVEAAVQDKGLPPGTQVRGMACLSACGRACTVAFQAPGKATYCFGDLQPAASTAAQVLACAALHAARPDGNLPRSERPPALQGGILLRLPPAVAVLKPPPQAGSVAVQA